MMNADIHALTGAYALDSVSGSERDQFEQHLAECESCAQEVRELRETAGRLGLAAYAEPPDHLKSAVLNRIRSVRQMSPEMKATPLRRRDRRPLALRLTSVAAAVLFAATVALGVVVVRQGEQLDDTRAQATEMSEILRAGDVRVVTTGRGEARMTVAMSRSANRMLILTKDLPNPPAGHDFQVWTGHGGEMVSAGFLDPDRGEALLEITDFGDADAIGVTVEPDGGSATPTLPAVMQIPLPAT